MSNYRRVMNNKISQLVAQRKALVNQAAFQRIEFAEAFETVSRPVKYLDKGFGAVRYLAKHPLLLTGVMAIAGAVSPKRWVKVIDVGLLIWRVGVAAKQRLKEQKD